MDRGVNYFVLLGALASFSARANPSELPPGSAIDENYRNQFAQCDARDVFQGVQFPIRGKSGKVIWYGCKSDPSRFTRFESLSSPGRPEAVLVEAKLAWDDDGSPSACSSAHGVTSQCPTSLKLDAPDPSHCVLPSKTGKECVPLNADLVPYVVIPSAAPKGIEMGAFQRLSNVKLGDYGVVIANGKVVPVIVGDEGPAYKIGEGSSALLRKLSNDGKLRTYASGAKVVLFPHTADDRGALSLDTLPEAVQANGSDLYSKLTKQ